ncbi:FlgB family protein [Loktanella agnita]|uniref:FlgB family protein n=1 Tax=Loktanella agnita TaxID=287097 RepID=UPI003986DE71
MYQSLDLFQTANAMARHAGARQAVVARNIANADTPGYQAQQISAFQDVYSEAGTGALRASRPGHIANLAGGAVAARTTAAAAEPSPNGNSVSIEDQMLSSVSITREHNRALAIYRHTMTVLRTSLGSS